MAGNTALIQVDQSGKVEQKEYDTVVAAVRNGVGSVVVLDRRVKRRILSERIQLKRKRKVLKLFAASVFLAVKPLLTERDMIAIDVEYPRQMGHVARLLKRMIVMNQLPIPESIETYSHGNLLRAHALARRPSQANYLIKIDERNEDILFKLYKAVSSNPR